LRGFQRDYGTSVAIAMAVMFEGAVKEHTMLLYSLLKRQETNIKVRELLMELAGESQHQARNLLEWWSKVEKSAPPRSGISQLIPSPPAIRQIHAVRDRRNTIVHENVELEPFEIQGFMTSVITVISSLNRLAERYERCVLIPSADGGKVVGESGELFEAKINETLRSLGYRDTTSDQGAFSRAYKFCTECRHIVRVTGVSGKRHVCPSCGRTAKLEGSWPSLVVQAERVIDGRMRPGRSTRMNSEPKHGKRAKNWVRGLAGGIAMALGPFGAPIQTVIDAQDDQRADRLDEILESLVVSNEEIERQIAIKNLVAINIQEGISNVLYQVAMNFRKSNHYEQALKNYAQNQEVKWPFVSVSAVSENELQDELVRLYGHNMPLLLSDLRTCGMDTSRLQSTGTPSADAWNVVLSLRGVDPRRVLTLAGVLHDKNPGSTILSGLSMSVGGILHTMQIPPTPST
jgi:hypothetical protein